MINKIIVQFGIADKFKLAGIKINHKISIVLLFIRAEIGLTKNFFEKQI